MEYDVAIIGCGPAGIQAAIHSSRMRASTIMIGHPKKSAIYGHRVENYFGLKGIDGGRLIEIGIEQAKEFGVQLLEEDVIKLEKTEPWFTIRTDNDSEVRSKALILAPGISRHKLRVEGEKEFLGKGVSYCASCDCNFFKGRVVAVVGNESEAASAALLLTGYASHVYWILDRMNAAPPLREKVKQAGVELLYPVRVKRILGDKLVNAVELDDGRTLEVAGIFIELGAKSSMELALELDLLPDPRGHIKVGDSCTTELEGIFACGDVTGEPWQIARAVGQGCVAGINAAKYAKREWGHVHGE